MFVKISNDFLIVKASLKYILLINTTNNNLKNYKHLHD